MKSPLKVHDGELLSGVSDELILGGDCRRRKIMIVAVRFLRFSVTLDP